MEDQRFEIDENWMNEGGLPPKEPPNIDDQLVFKNLQTLNADPEFQQDEAWMHDSGLPPKEPPNIDDQLVLKKLQTLNADPKFQQDTTRKKDLSKAVRISLMSQANITKALQLLDNPENPQSPDGQSPDAQYRDTAA